MEPDTQPPVMDPVRWDAFGTLAFVFLVLISMALANAYSPKGYREDAGLVTSSVEVRSLLLQEALNSYAASSSPMAAKTQQETTRKSYEKSIQDLTKKKGRPDDRQLAALYLASGQDVPQSVIRSAQKAAQGGTADALKLGSEAPDPALVEKVRRWAPQDPTEKLLRLGALRHAKEEAKIGPLFDPLKLLAFAAVCAVGSIELLAGVIVLLVVVGALPKFRLACRGFACGPVSNLMAGELAARTVAFLVLYTLSSVPFALFPALNDIPHGGSTLLHGGAAAAAALFAAWFPVGPYRGLRRIWGRVRAGEGLQVGLAGLCANAPVLLLSLPLVMLLSKVVPEPVHPINTMLAKGTGIWETLAIVVVGSVFAPVAEETVFRGMLFPALSKLTRSVAWGAVLQGFLFAAIHPQGPAGWPPIMAIGVVSALITYRTGALWPSMLMHGLHNGIILMLNVTLNRL